MGKVEIDHTGSGSGITLSSDGTDLLLDGTAIGGGGGGADLFAENYGGSATKPSATGSDCVAIGKNAVAANGASLAAGAFASSGGNLSTAVGLYSNVGSSGSYAVALGWGYANGTNSLAAAIGNNTSVLLVLIVWLLDIRLRQVEVMPQQ